MNLERTLKEKKGPLPVWAWALIVAVGAFLAYRRYAGSATSPASSTTSTPTGSAVSDQTPVTSGDTGSPPASGQGSAADNVNDTLLSQLSGLGSSVDALTAAVQTTPAFSGAGGDFSGSSGAMVYDYPPISDTGSTSTGNGAVPATSTTPAVTHPAAKVASTPTRYYTYKKNVPLAKGQALHFTTGKGYYAA